MFVDLPQNLILMTLGAFLLGWVLGSISARLGSGTRARKRDPRDDRIRSLEADQRVTKTNLEDKAARVEALETELADAKLDIEKRDNVITHQQSKLEKAKGDLIDSVKKTRELRDELKDRAVDAVKHEAKLREVETELSVAQASSDMIATGVLDYALAPETDYTLATDDDDSDDGDSHGEQDLSEAAR